MSGMQLILRRKGLGWFPADPVSEDRTVGVPAGSDTLFTASMPRNLKQLKAVHILLKKVADNHPQFTTVEALKRELKVRCKMFDPFVGANGKLYFALRSIAVEAMDQIEFTAVWEQWKRVIVTEILPGISDEALVAELAEEFS